MSSPNQVSSSETAEKITPIMENGNDKKNVCQFVNATSEGEIPSFNGSDQDKATDFANYFCSYAQLYHQKQMLADHNRMAAYHAAIMGNAHVFKDKVVMDVGTGSGILAVWCAQAGARRVYAIEYTDMAKHARSVMEANGVSDVVTVIQGAVEDIELPMEQDQLEPEDPSSSQEEGKKHQVVDIIISEWMGYFLLRESMLDSLIRARDKFLKPKTGLMLPSHTTMYFAPIFDEEERKISNQEYSGAMSDWGEFVDSTQSVYGVNMSILGKDFEKEQKEYYLLSSRWAELRPDAVLSEPVVVKELDMMTCTLADSKGITYNDPRAQFDFDIVSDDVNGPVSGFAGWFTANFQSRTDEVGRIHAPQLPSAAFLSTGPEAGYTHWGQQTFHLVSSIPLIKGETTNIRGCIEMSRTKENARLYNCRIRYESSRRKSGEEKDGVVLMKGGVIEHVYQIP
eukprot:CAMPEP_0184862932 /NCGR_PEP_ID=MMETSP0580-20130426/8152_1 /TAXON_ID=1118495 /ORGANISM="Dactyliosolen fragilissimus" /LENGTH=453 /DNA_ID=CAMNT_0027360951 /DNA_START=542 /DNA_END=1906 /DNA_ORIENTATION=+